MGVLPASLHYNNDCVVGSRYRSTRECVCSKYNRQTRIIHSFHIGLLLPLHGRNVFHETHHTILRVPWGTPSQRNAAHSLACIIVGGCDRNHDWEQGSIEIDELVVIL
jgi:hypothetical protein